MFENRRVEHVLSIVAKVGSKRLSYTTYGKHHHKPNERKYELVEFFLIPPPFNVLSLIWDKSFKIKGYL